MNFDKELTWCDRQIKYHTRQLNDSFTHEALRGHSKAIIYFEELKKKLSEVEK